LLFAFLIFFAEINSSSICTDIQRDKEIWWKQTSTEKETSRETQTGRQTESKNLIYYKLEILSSPLSPMLNAFELHYFCQCI
jgi:hypothetical protein